MKIEKVEKFKVLDKEFASKEEAILFIEEQKIKEALICYGFTSDDNVLINDFTDLILKLSKDKIIKINIQDIEEEKPEPQVLFRAVNFKEEEV